MIEHILLAVAVTGWAVSYILYYRREEWWNERYRTEYNRNAREIDELRRRQPRASEDQIRQIARAKAAEEHWRDAYKNARVEAKKLRLMELLTPETDE